MWDAMVVYEKITHRTGRPRTERGDMAWTEGPSLRLKFHSNPKTLSGACGTVCPFET